MDFLTQITPHSIVLTPNRRLSAHAIKKYNRLQHEKNISCWSSLDALPFSSWIQRCFQNYANENIETLPFILTPTQEIILWEEIIRQSAQAEHLLQVSGTAELIQSAWVILKQWRFPITHPELNSTEDAAHFQEWAKQFQTRCQKYHWLDSSALIEYVTDLIQKKKIKLPKNIYLFGFTELTPQQEFLFAECKTQGCTLIQPTSHKISTHTKKINLLDEETELLTMAKWAKSLHENNSNVSIGCIVPNLEKKRDHIVRVFSRVFSDEKKFTLNPLSFPFNISAGKPLTSYPIIHCAFQLLSLADEFISHETISELLHTPFIGDAEKEKIQRYKWDIALKQQPLTIIFKTILNDDEAPAKFKKHFNELIHFFETLPHQLKISEWTAIFNKALTLAGWPGERSLNSQEYQLVHRFLDLLNEFSQLEKILPNVSYKTALHYFNRMASKTIFQIQSPDAPIQILGLLEATELNFDAVWITGMDDQTWPPTPKPNPFIPLHLQKKLNMPHASSDRELHYCRELLNQLKNTAKQVFFSYAQQTADTPLRPSALIHDIPDITLEKLSLAEFTSPEKNIYDTKQIELLKDENGPPIQSNEKIRGGTSIFKLQAACPFKSFSELRLHAKAIESPQLGLKATERGTLLHETLQLIWAKLKNHKTLCSYSESELISLVQESVSAALAPFGKMSRYLLLESQRLEKLVLRWLEYEKSRPPFEVIAREKETKATVANIPITLRIDRIDAFPDGSQLIIDYKSGKQNNIKYWFTERPEEPQLPLYSIVHPEKTAGIVFAQISAEKMQLMGVSQNNLALSSVKLLSDVKYTTATSWSEQLTAWKKTLENLAHAFCKGKASVHPKQPNETCRHCHLHSLCRIYEVVDENYEYEIE